MSFQSTVSLAQGFGVPGEIFDNGPVRSQPYIILSDSAAYNIIGATACMYKSEGVCRAGNPLNINVFAGILANPKVNKLLGDTSSSLNPTLTVPNQTIVECVTMGSMIVTLPAAASIGDLVIFDNTTGALSTIPPGTVLPAGKTYAFAYVDRFTVGAAGLAVITINAPAPALVN